VEAGLGLDAAMARVAKVGDGPLASELLRTLQDMRSGMSRAEALRALAERADVPELRQFVSAVIQADSHGVPIARVLRIQSRELRTKRRQLAEEKAMKLPVKVLFPTVAFIFPALFVVLLGPAVMQIGRTL
jgi:tight adherence protein C